VHNDAVRNNNAGFSRCPDKSNFCARSIRLVERVSTTWRREARRFTLRGRLHSEMPVSLAVAALQANYLVKSGSLIAITTSMDVHITGHNISKTLRRYMERSLNTALGEAVERVVALDVELSDVNRRLTGTDNLCGIRAELRRAGVVFVHGRSTDAHVAVDQAGMRLRTALTTWPASRTYGRFDSAS
jgi:hypothetical protein